MNKISVTLHKDRDYVGKLHYFGKEFMVCAKINEEVEDQLEPIQAGRYKLTGIKKTPDNIGNNIIAFGPYMLFFQSINDPDKILVLHGGDVDDEGSLLPTEGSLRMSNEDLEFLVSNINEELDLVEMHIEEDHAGILSNWLNGTKVSSKRPIRSYLDERAYYSTDNGPDLLDWISLYNLLDSNDSSMGFNSEPEFIPGGGDFGGGGANGQEDLGPESIPNNDEPDSNVTINDHMDNEALPIIHDPFSTHHYQEPESIPNGVETESQSYTSDTSQGTNY